MGMAQLNQCQWHPIFFVDWPDKDLFAATKMYDRSRMVGFQLAMGNAIFTDMIFMSLIYTWIYIIYIVILVWVLYPALFGDLFFQGFHMWVSCICIYILYCIYLLKKTDEKLTLYTFLCTSMLQISYRETIHPHQWPSGWRSLLHQWGIEWHERPVQSCGIGFVGDVFLET